MFLAVSEIVAKVDEAFLWIGGICMVLLLGIVAVMVLFVIRYGRDRHPKSAHVEGNTPLEVTWIVIPTLIVLFMFYKGYEGFRLMRDVPPDAMVVEVEGRQWSWTFHYPEEGITSPELYVPVDTPVRCNLSSPPNDVVHSFYLPDFRVKEDCVPGRRTHLWFQADRVGEHHIFCAEFCGKDHSKMISRLHVMTREDYDAWVDRILAHRFKPIDMVQAMDPRSEEVRACAPEKLFLTYCASCHGPAGRGGLVAGARDFRKLDGWKRSPKLVDIYRTLEEGLKGTQMRSFANLSRWDRFALMHYVASFYKGSDRPESTPEDIRRLVEEYKLDEQQEFQRRFPIDEAMRAIAAGAGEGKRGR